MNGIRPTVGIEFDDKYTNAKNKLLDFVKALDELNDIQRTKLAQEKKCLSPAKKFVPAAGYAVHPAEK